MFNSYKGGDTNIKVNAVSGTMVKNFKDSFFLSFEIGSSLEKRLFNKEPKLSYPNKDDYNYPREEPVVVIQTMIIGDKIMLAEVMWKKDFDAMFENNSEEGRQENHDEKHRV